MGWFRRKFEKVKRIARDYRAICVAVVAVCVGVAIGANPESVQGVVAAVAGGIVAIPTIYGVAATEGKSIINNIVAGCKSIFRSKKIITPGPQVAPPQVVVKPKPEEIIKPGPDVVPPVVIPKPVVPKELLDTLTAAQQASDRAVGKVREANTKLNEVKDKVNTHQAEIGERLESNQRQVNESMQKLDGVADDVKEDAHYNHALAEQVKKTVTGRSTVANPPLQQPEAPIIVAAAPPAGQPEPMAPAAVPITPEDNNPPLSLTESMEEKANLLSQTVANILTELTTTDALLDQVSGNISTATDDLKDKVDQAKTETITAVGKATKTIEEAGEQLQGAAGALTSTYTSLYQFPKAPTEEPQQDKNNQACSSSDAQTQDKMSPAL